jgi:hypothetical protein
MQQLRNIKNFNYILETKKDLKKLLDKIMEKYNLIKFQDSKDNYLKNYLNCKDIINLINYTKENINYKLINITEEKKEEFFKDLKYDFDYIDIINNKPNFTAGVFLVPKGNSLPLHNHPNMIVCTKLLFGKILIKNYDRINSNNDNNNNNFDNDFFKVKEKEKILLEINDISILTPFENNIHSIHALEDSAFFDIILPAYDDESGRECDYYKIINKFDNEKNKEIFMQKI